MIDLKYIGGYFPPHIASNAGMQKHILKEYVELMVLDYLSTTAYIHKLAFIGGTNLRLIKGIDRFSEDLDFDCKGLGRSEFMQMTDDVVSFLKNSGLRVETRDKANDRLTAFRRNIYFPELLFELGLTGHREERFLLKIEAQDQGVDYAVETRQVQGCGFFFTVPAPSDSVLLSMKLCALLSRAKGRDFYDSMFLMQQTRPSYEFLNARIGISSPDKLKSAIAKKLKEINLNIKMKDFEHLLLNHGNANRILHFEDACLKMTTI